MKAVHNRTIEHLPCAAGTLRRASRSLARLYDAHLVPSGLTTTQFSILRSVQRQGGRVPLAELADDLVFERTSLYRALAPLRRAGLVSIAAGGDRRTKEVVLTARAGRRIAAAMPHWREAQRAVLERFGLSAWHELAGDLRHITTLARTARAE
jgi:DNA-binding MarR family transcriptional regulator